MTEMKSHNLATPVAIVIAGAFIALALFFSGQSAGPAGSSNDNGSDFGNNNSGVASSISAVNENDNIFGNPDARVTIIEFSDYECPFCARLHPTLERVVAESDGQVNWVYRHFPLTSIHSNAEPAAIAAECVARLAGNDAFWEFSNGLFANQRSLNSSVYTTLAAEHSISASALATCMADASVASEVTAQFEEAVAAGGRGTPFSVVVSASGEFFPFSGALPYEQLKPIIDQALVN